MSSLFGALAAALACLLSTPAAGQVAAGWPVPGVDGAPRPLVGRLWEPPATPWGPGHRGVDLVTAAGAPVRAVAAGRVAFAGRVAGRGVVTVELADTGSPPLRTTYEPVRAAVAEGERVAAGEVVGELAPGEGPRPYHCARPCLHWGLLRGERYLDPLTLLPPGALGGGPSRLLPTAGVPLPEPADGVREAWAARRSAPGVWVSAPAPEAPPGPALSPARPPVWRAVGAPTSCGSG